MLCWTVHLKGPSLHSGHAAVTVGHKLYTFGNNFYPFNGEIDVNVFNTVSLRWKKLPLWAIGRESALEVPPKHGPTAVLIEDMIYIWGGTPYSNILYAFDVDTHRWFKPVVSGTIPEARERHSACVLGKAMYIYGGFNQESGFRVVTNDIYKLDTITMVWTLINTRGTTTGPYTESHTSTIIGTKMFVFGGTLDDLYHIRVFDTETNLWLSTPSAQPEARRGHSAFNYNGELYISGGETFNGYFKNDMWKFSPETLSWKKVEPSWKVVEPILLTRMTRSETYYHLHTDHNPPCMYKMNCCMVGDCAIFFGGHHLYILDFSPSLKTLCKLAVIQYGLDQSELPHDIRWELKALTAANSNRKRPRCF